MKRTLACLAAVAALLAFSQAPAVAASLDGKTQISASDELSAKRKHRKYRSVRVAPYGWDAPVAWRGPVSDPSIGYFPNYWRARASGRCVVDLGYGRYEYCGW
jgi:hypothetical protein